MIDGAIFDADGTILDSMFIWDKAGEIYLANMGITAEPNLGKIMFSMTMTEGAEYLKNTYAMKENTDQIMEGINRTVENFYVNEVQPKLGVKSFIAELYKNGIPMTVATSSDRPVIMAALKRLKMNQYFKEILTCTITGKGKEFPDIYYNAARIMNARPENTVVFEDAIHAARTALAAGFIVAGVYDSISEDSQEGLKKITDYYIKDFNNDSPVILKKLL